MTPYNSALAGRLLEAANAMAVEPGSIARVPGGELVVDPGGLGEIHGRYAPYMTDEDLTLAFMATGNDFPDLALWPREIPTDLLDTDFAISAGRAVIGAVRATAKRPPGPWSAALTAAGIARRGKNIYDAIDENDQEHSNYLISVELVRRSNYETFSGDFTTVFNTARKFVGDANRPDDGNPAP